MTTYATGNPVPSTAVKDLYDNSENLDTALNDLDQDSWSDRLGRPRKTWSRIERLSDANTAIAAAERAEDAADDAAQYANALPYETEVDLHASEPASPGQRARVWGDTADKNGIYTANASGIYVYDNPQPLSRSAIGASFQGLAENLILNGNLANDGISFPQYQGTSYATVAAPPLSSVTSATLAALGIQGSFKFPAAASATEVFASILLPKGGNPAYASGYASLLVSSSGGWADGTISPRLFYTYGAPDASAGLSTQVLAVSETNDIDATTREYVWRFEYPTSLPVGQVVRGFNLGFVMAAPATSTAYEVSGFWISTRKAPTSISGPLLKEGVAWPDWSAVVGSQPSLSTRIENSRATNKNKRFFASLAADLDNGLMSIRYGALGDSIKRGNGATGASSTIPPGETNSNHTYEGQNPNNFDCRSQFNRMVARWVEAYSDQTQYTLGNRIPEIGQRIAYCTKNHVIPLDVVDHRFTFRDLISRRELPKTNVVTVPNASAPYQGYVPVATVSASQANRVSVEFDMRGDNLTVLFAIYAGTQSYDLYLNDALHESVTISGSTTWNGSRAHSFPYGNYRVRLVPTTSAPIRLIGFGHNRMIEMVNFAISGTNTNEWQPGHASGLLGPVLTSGMDYLEPQLGTNDRAAGVTWPPQHPTRTQRGMRVIVENIQAAMPDCKILLSVTPAVPHANDFPVIANFYGQRDVARVIKQLAVEKGLDFVDQYTPFVVGLQDGLTLHADNLHPNDAGYKIMDDTWLQRLINASTPYYANGPIRERIPGMAW